MDGHPRSFRLVTTSSTLPQGRPCGRPPSAGGRIPSLISSDPTRRPPRWERAVATAAHCGDDYAKQLSSSLQSGNASGHSIRPNGNPSSSRNLVARRNALARIALRCTALYYRYSDNCRGSSLFHPSICHLRLHESTVARSQLEQQSSPSCWYQNQPLPRNSIQRLLRSYRCCF
jgi:hypothetical protein